MSSQTQKSPMELFYTWNRSNESEEPPAFMKAWIKFAEENHKGFVTIATFWSEESRQVGFHLYNKDKNEYIKFKITPFAFKSATSPPAARANQGSATNKLEKVTKRYSKRGNAMIIASGSIDEEQ